MTVNVERFMMCVNSSSSETDCESESNSETDLLQDSFDGEVKRKLEAVLTDTAQKHRDAIDLNAKHLKRQIYDCLQQTNPTRIKKTEATKGNTTQVDKVDDLDSIPHSDTRDNSEKENSRCTALWRFLTTGLR
jgi:hypothetical protein